MNVSIGLLGPVDVHRGATRLHLTGRRARSLLALLALNAGSTVPDERIARLVWGGRAPARLAQKLVSALRGLLGDPALIARDGGGYALRVPRSSVDAHVFDTRCADARAALSTGDATTAAALFAEALGLWRGDAFCDTGEELAAAFAPGLAERRLAARRGLAEARLALGDHDGLTTELAELITGHPLDEALRGLHLTALDRAGRRGDAIGEYHAFRRLLDDELGVEPGPALRALYAGLITERRDTGDVPRQLPPPPAHFVGREDALTALDAAAPGVIAVTGSPGVGKTALALHWAHTRAGAFPDGQVHLNLHGFDESPPTPPEVALERLLATVGVPAAGLPSDVEDRAAAWRTATAGKRMLVLLDNAHGTPQIRLLLPGGDTATVLVTSRDALAGTVALHGAHRVALAPLTGGEAARLLDGVLGPVRTAREPEAVRAVIASCAALPLALRVAAERAARRPRLPLSALAAELADAEGGLDALDGGDPLTRVRGVLACSLRDLPAGTARLFRLLGLHPNAAPTVHFAANLAGIPVTEARRGLERLCDASLLDAVGTGRYAMHDLLRAFAAATAREAGDPAERTLALSRALAWHAHTADLAMDAIAPTRHPTARHPGEPLHPCEPFADTGTASAWLAVELPALEAGLRLAAAHGLHREVRDLHYPLVAFLLQRREVARALDVLALAAASAAHLGDGHAEADIAFQRGSAHAAAHRLGEAGEHHRRAAALYERAGDARGLAAVLRGLGVTAGRAGDFTAALGLFHRAADAARAAGDTVEFARCGVNIATIHTHLGDHAAALPLYERAHAFFTAAGDLTSATTALAGRSYCLVELGRLGEAAGEAARAVDLARRLGSLDLEEYGLINLAMARSRMGDHGAATAAIERAVEIVDATGDRQRECAIYRSLGHIRRAAGDAEGATAAFRASHAMATAIGDEETARATAGDLTAGS